MLRVDAGQMANWGQLDLIHNHESWLYAVVAIMTLCGCGSHRSQDVVAALHDVICNLNPWILPCKYFFVRQCVGLYTWLLIILCFYVPFPIGCLLEVDNSKYTGNCHSDVCISLVSWRWVFMIFHYETDVLIACSLMEFYFLSKFYIWTSYTPSS